MRGVSDLLGVSGNYDSRMHRRSCLVFFLFSRGGCCRSRKKKGELFFDLPTPFWPYCISIAPSLIVTLLLLMLVKAPMSGIPLSRLLPRALLVVAHELRELGICSSYISGLSAARTSTRGRYFPYAP